VFRELVQKARRAVQRPPAYVARRILAEVAASSERWRAPWRARRTTAASLCHAFGEQDANSLWGRLLANQVLPSGVHDAAEYERICPGAAARIFTQAQNALDRRVQFLGTRPHLLGEEIDWHSDFKVGKTWPPNFFRDIRFANLELPSDVKIPWELSRLQWLIPLGQAYAFTADERYSSAARRIIESWIAENPYAYSVNWGCAMEAAMRSITLIWLFYALGKSAAWQEKSFREEYLVELWLTLDFVDRNIERADINGNHFTADAAALVVGGQFFGDCAQGIRWLQAGREDLEREIELQVFADGVDYEASVPYHRLVLELFFAAAFALRQRQTEVSEVYARRLGAMARFVAAYSRPDGSTPLWGDADDARVLPFGNQPLHDHRYLIGLVGLLLDDDDLIAMHAGSVDEAFWWFGPSAAQRLTAVRSEPLASQAFREGGVFVMRNQSDHIFIDCGPIGLAGKGGHGHNDALAFEAMLSRVLLVTDSGSYVYTSDSAARNRFRGTSMHNTAQVDGAEMNSFIAPDNLWQLADEAKASAFEWSTDGIRDIWSGSHSGYRKLSDPVEVRRRIILEHGSHSLVISDHLLGCGWHEVTIPLQLGPGVAFEADCAGGACLRYGETKFRLRWSSNVAWTLTPLTSQISPSYGMLVDVNRLEWHWSGVLPCDLTLFICPGS
jgi:hypothetical protein